MIISKSLLGKTKTYQAKLILRHKNIISLEELCISFDMKKHGNSDYSPLKRLIQNKAP